MNEELETLYNGKLLGAANPQTLKSRAEKIGIHITLEQARAFIRSHQTAQQFRYVNPRPFHVSIVGKPNQYACDLMFVQRGTEKVPILVVEELTSRLGYARVMPNKLASITLATFKLILNDIENDGGKVESLEHDAGSEFKGVFREFLVEKNIEDITFPRGNASKTALGKLNVMIRTIRTMLLKATMNFGGDWRQKLKDVMEFYNSVKSVATGFAPEDAKKEHTQNYIRMIEIGKGTAARKKVDAFKIGQKVRVLINYDVFRRHRVKPHFSKDIFTIAERQGYSFKLKNDKDEWVMADSEKGDPQNYIRLWRAWELLQVDKTIAPPVQEPIQELPIREQRRANITNRERRALDAPVLENPANLPQVPNPVENVVERAIENDDIGERARTQTEAAKQAEEEKSAKEVRQALAKTREKRPRKKPELLGSNNKEKPTDPDEWFVDKVLAHRRRKNKLEFQIQWKGIPEDDERRFRWFPLSPTFKTRDTIDEVVGKYMRDNKLR
jgi:hypothetical protein